MRKDISVIAKMSSDKRVTPLQIVWEDGRVFDIDKILDVRPAASTKGGGIGLRYRVRIGQNERYLFLDGYVWFIEV